jgi:hypothetical protein
MLARGVAESDFGSGRVEAHPAATRIASNVQTFSPVGKEYLIIAQTC